MDNLKDDIVFRYGWIDYDDFKISAKHIENVWCYKAVADVIKLEAENAKLKAELKAIKANIKAKYQQANDVFGLNLGELEKDGEG